MKNSISLFPILEEHRARDVFDVKTPHFYYTENGHDYELSKDAESGTYVLDDERGLWNADDCNIKIKWAVTCKRPISLYDVHSLNSVACGNAKIGIALQWYSKTSQQRGTIPFGTISNDSYIAENFECSHDFEKSVMRGAIGFSLILYIQKAGKPTDEELHFANIPGYIVGSLSSCEAVLDGYGSDFPIFEVSNPGGPLWTVSCDINSPDSDTFGEHVAVYINKDHSSYQKLNKNGKEYDPQMSVEVMSQVLLLIIETLRADGYDFSNFDDAQSGSIASALSYFKEVLCWDFDSPLTVSKSINEHLEKSLVKGKA